MSPGLTAAVMAASTSRAIGSVIAVIALTGFVVYAVINIRAGRDEVGSEIELAPNRKPYLDDEALEGRKLDRTLSVGLLTLAVVAVGLPLYWLNEPGRSEGAVEEYERVFVSRGADLFAPTGDNLQALNCAGCHGDEGVGGLAAYTLSDADGEFVATINWRAPALNNVLQRYSIEELTYVLVYGRPFSPMPAWGVDGGGPLNEQQIENLIAYIQSIQITSDESKRAAEIELATALGLLTTADAQDPEKVEAAIAEIDYDDPATGEALFNLGRESGFAGGAYACGRCHTRGWSIIVSDSEDNPSPNPPDADISDFVGHPDGSGGLGPSLRGGLIPRQFLSVAEMVEFITLGTVDGARYGQSGQGSGKMPGFGDNPNTEDAVDDGMLTPEMICAIVRYEATLDGGDPPSGPCTAPAEDEAEDDDAGDEPEEETAS